MKILNEKTALVAVGALRAHPQNPNRGDVGAISKSIAVNGFYGTIIAQKSTGYILAGNHRFEAARAEGAKEVPVTWVDVDDRAAVKILLADNRAAELAHRDGEALATLLDALAAEDDLVGTLYEADDVRGLLEALEPSGADEWSDEDEGPRVSEDEDEEDRDLLEVRFRVPSEHYEDALNAINALGFDVEWII